MGSSGQIFGISTHDAIAALIWRNISLARYRAGILSDGSIAHFCQAIDCRARLHLPKPYFGNAIYAVKTSLALPLLLDAQTVDTNKSSGSGISHSILGLQTAARAIREEINGATADKFQDLLSFVERTEMEMLTWNAVVEDLSAGSVMPISYFGFEMHELDFGEAFGVGGKMEAFRLPSQGLVPGVPVVLPRLPDGSCEFMVNEREEVMRFFAEDETLRRFASEVC